MTAWERAGRPKPPRLNHEYILGYVYRHETLLVSKRRNQFSMGAVEVWAVTDYIGRQSRSFPTHAEAVAYAHKLAQERSQS